MVNKLNGHVGGSTGVLGVRFGETGERAASRNPEYDHVWRECLEKETDQNDMLYAVTENRLTQNE